MTMPSSLRLKSQPTEKKQQPQLPSSLRPKQKQQFSDSDFISDEESQRELERGQATAFSRLGESFLGAPGDISSFIAGLFGKEQNILPTSQKLREFSEKTTGGYTKPKNEFEESVGDVISDVGSMAFPGSGHYTLARNIGIPIVGGLVKEGLKYSNADEKAQAYGKVGTMVALDLLSRKSGGVKSYINSLFNKAEQSIPKGVSVQATGLEKSLNNLEKSLSSGGNRPTTKKALEKLNEIKSEIKNGKVDVKRLAAYRPSINEAIEELGGFNFDVPRKLKPQAIRNLNQVKSEVIKTLDQYGEKFNPEFLKANRSANESYAALQKSNLIANFLKEKIPYSPKSKAVQSLFSYAPAVAATGLAALSPATAAGAVTGLAGYQGVKTLHRVLNSPTLRKYYQNVLKEASAGNIPQTSKNLKALDLLMDENRPEGKKSS